MARVMINEGLIDRFIVGVFNAVLQGKRRSIQKAMAADPELKRIVAELEQSKKDLKDFLEKNKSATEMDNFLTGL